MLYKKEVFSMGFVVSAASSGEVQRIAEGFGAFHDLYLAGTSPLLARVSSLLLLGLPITMFGAPGIAAASYHHGSSLGRDHMAECRGLRSKVGGPV